jgi:hypothetical protein
MTSHTLAELYASQVANSIWLELGADKFGKQHGSTSFLQDLASRYNAEFISVDIERSNNPLVVQSDAVDFCRLYDFQKRLGLVYLDNFDWIWNPQEYRETAIANWMTGQISNYKSRGVVMNNVNSSLSHLNQIKSLDGAWADSAVVIMDDTWFDHKNDVFCGKGNAAIYYLLSQNWQVLNGEYSESYIIIGKNIIPTGTLFDTDALNKFYGIVWKKP